MCWAGKKNNIDLTSPEVARQTGGKPQTFTAPPLGVSLLSFQTFCKGHLRRDGIIPIKYVKEPLRKDLEANPTAD
ncbi:MAG: hypothetical protein A2157_10455 [Deltaproteobacteria bacterium RBG_16_47_11]|nr:MAG: hypothetical protein A2157_10455 [Deltaproteobacteria bacterium RBG_16_47_11]